MVLRGPSGWGLSLLPSPSTGILGKGLMGDFGNFSLLGTLGVPAPLGSFPFLLHRFHGRSTCGRGSGWVRHHCYFWDVAPSMGIKEGHHVGHLFFVSHTLRNVCGLLVRIYLCDLEMFARNARSVYWVLLLVENLKIFFNDVLNGSSGNGSLALSSDGIWSSCE